MSNTTEPSDLTGTDQDPQPADSNPVLENLEWLQRTRADRLAARRDQG
ncbi:hypothetical protein [Streptomyces sp. NPDC001108]